MSRKLIFVVVTGVLIFATTFSQLPKPTIYHHRYQEHRLSCLWGGAPADGGYVVTHSSDGTRGGEYSFWRNGKVVATCNIEDDFESR